MMMMIMMTCLQYYIGTVGVLTSNCVQCCKHYAKKLAVPTNMKKDYM